ncbi:Crp/Fnr family transcriptional regulator [bacterium]|nr:MAG: Crp/Fnr family transcriptional regulator [bacterium]
MIVIDRISDAHLAELPLFENLTIEQLAQARSVLHRTVFPPGHALLCEKQVGDRVYFVLHGVVRLCIQRGARDVIVGMRGPGDLLGEISVIDGGPRLASFITHTYCTCLAVSHEDFHNVLWEIRPFAINLAKLMAQRVRLFTDQLEAMATLSVPGRLARQLYILAEEYGTPVDIEGSFAAIEIPFRLTQADLSHMIGATRVQVNQIICQWKKRNIIDLRNNRVVILDDLALQALIAGTV